MVERGGGSQPGSSKDNAEIEVWLSPASPLLRYYPSRNAPPGRGWSLSPQGSSINQGHGTFSVEYNGHFSSFTWLWAAPSGYVVTVALDGRLSSTPATGGIASLKTTPQNHNVTLSASCETCSGKDHFALLGARFSTPLDGPASSNVELRNATLDDSSSEITYSGFTKSSSSSLSGDPSLEVIKAGKFYQNTISYTATRGASAKFSLRAIYIFGVTGPSFGEFGISIDQRQCGFFNSSTSTPSYNTLLFFGTGFGEGKHNIEIINREEGKLLALDYFVATSSIAQDGGGGGGGGGGGMPGTPPVGGPFQGGGGDNHGIGNGSAGAVIGGILGALAALVRRPSRRHGTGAQAQAILVLLWRYWRWRQAGGEGDFLAACCGPRRKVDKPPDPFKDDFRIWPMLRSRPKYATYA